MKSFLINKLVNSQVIKVHRISEITSFIFQTSDMAEIHLHVSCFLRIFDANGGLLVCSTNLSDKSPNYKKRWFQKYDWTRFGSTVFDDALKDCFKSLSVATVLNVEFDNDDVLFKFDNGMRMEILVSVTKYDDINYCENYMFFEKGKNGKHFEV